MRFAQQLPSQLLLLCLAGLVSTPSTSALPVPSFPSLRNAIHRGTLPIVQIPLMPTPIKSVLTIIDEDEYHLSDSGDHPAVEDSIFSDSFSFGSATDSLVASPMETFRIAPKQSANASKKTKRSTIPSAPKKRKSAPAAKRAVPKAKRTGSPRVRPTNTKGVVGTQAPKLFVPLASIHLPSPGDATYSASAPASTASTWVLIDTVSTSTIESASPETEATSTATSTEARSSASAQETTTTGLVLGGTHTGDATWFTPGVGACGTLSSSTDPVVSVSSALFDSYPGQASTNPNDNPICGRTIQITYNKIRTVNVTVVDRCEDCDEWDVNLSPTSFADLAEVGEGRLEDVKWHFV